MVGVIINVFLGLIVAIVLCLYNLIKSINNKPRKSRRITEEDIRKWLGMLF